MLKLIGFLICVACALFNLPGVMQGEVASITSMIWCSACALFILTLRG